MKLRIQEESRSEGYQRGHVMSPPGLGTKNDYAGEGQQQYTCLLAYLRLQRVSLITVTCTSYLQA
jgi:hypothetical protein